MESSQIFGAAEECHSSDSGWTMYIGSPIDDDGHSDDGDTEANREDNSDDSMASDASSGPCHHRNPWGNYEEGKGQSHGKAADCQQAAAQEEEFDDDKCYSIANQTKERKIAGKKLEKKEVLFIGNNKGKAPAHSGGKARIHQNHRLGKRK
ncbi:hypothetical protein L6164_014459 [Bauhinia variegata]|uniref:Uncharacterized protein n=1 Tax=Bauhinia variegata TaxID=167791 RepID=A0ACB9NJC7_BAUVA|nr:hypothetical protein L6164_014459 [Bauhinia variegata]